MPEINKDQNIFRRIFFEHWDEFTTKHPAYNTDYYEEVIGKMLDCGKEGMGYSEYRCCSCGGDVRRICFTCKSCFCLSCSKAYTDNFVARVSGILQPGLRYRHIVLTMPRQLRRYFYKRRHGKKLLSTLMRCGYTCLEEFAGSFLKQTLKIGAIVVVQTHGRSGRYNPHLHIIMTSGGINEKTGKWVELGYFPYNSIHKSWQYHLFSMLKEFDPSSKMKSLINHLYQKYPNGLVANVSKGEVPEKCRGLAKYLAKYVASPPIAVRRIIKYTGSHVTYWYKDHYTKKKKVVTVDVFTFVGRMVQHIMPKGFQRIRYYGLQATKTFKKWSGVIKEGLKRAGQIVKGVYEIIKKKKYRERYQEMSGHDPLLCRYCGEEMVIWKIWHPDYGVIYDESENVEAGNYDGWFEEDSGGRGTLRPATGGVPIPLFAL